MYLWKLTIVAIWWYFTSFHLSCFYKTRTLNLWILWGKWVLTRLYFSILLFLLETILPPLKFNESLLNLNMLKINFRTNDIALLLPIYQKDFVIKFHFRLYICTEQTLIKKIKIHPIYNFEFFLTLLPPLKIQKNWDRVLLTGAWKYWSRAFLSDEF
jgi:hypothetical protein